MTTGAHESHDVATDGGERTHKYVRVHGGVVEWRCRTCASWQLFDANECLTCGTPRRRFRQTDRARLRSQVAVDDSPVDAAVETAYRDEPDPDQQELGEPQFDEPLAAAPGRDQPGSVELALDAARLDASELTELEARAPEADDPAAHAPTLEVPDVEVPDVEVRDIEGPDVGVRELDGSPGDEQLLPPTAEPAPLPYGRTIVVGSALLPGFGHWLVRKRASAATRLVLVVVWLVAGLSWIGSSSAVDATAGRIALVGCVLIWIATVVDTSRLARREREVLGSAGLLWVSMLITVALVAVNVLPWQWGSHTLIG